MASNRERGFHGRWAKCGGKKRAGNAGGVIWQAAEKLGLIEGQSSSGDKARQFFSALTAPVELVPFPDMERTEFFRSLLRSW